MANISIWNDWQAWNMVGFGAIKKRTVCNSCYGKGNWKWALILFFKFPVEKKEKQVMTNKINKHKINTKS